MEISNPDVLTSRPVERVSIMRHGGKGTKLSPVTETDHAAWTTLYVCPPIKTDAERDMLAKFTSAVMLIRPAPIPELERVASHEALLTAVHGQPGVVSS